MVRLFITATIVFVAIVTYRLIWIHLVKPMLEKEKDNVGKQEEQSGKSDTTNKGDNRDVI